MGAPELQTIKEDAKYDLDLERYDFDPWLLEDHPLRSHPTECIPGLTDFLADKLAFARSKQFLCRLGSVIFVCIAVIQCVRIMPALVEETLSSATS
ncbi:hypothetical protein N7492_005460 [Penicillium capsulatum]|uniref:Uncharacterized protein n=1 Tax=Penicillium capsulatum TaxID=69766 RepID=A0A9W9IDG2_9EURO|nr:hypothetical protein N7492_005460 [Penicillium capsulatum]KAJ6135439.1 hypothetical protein N7512_000599 [Penicillium capsulatum]